jgi:F-type H+-transporting ATPase subunit gamma
MSGLAQAVGQSESAPRLLAGTGSDQVHLLVVMTAERGLCGGFNSSIVKLARVRIDSLKAEGKTVKILTVGKKGREQLKRDYEDLFVGHVDLSDVKRLGYANAADIASDLLDRFDAGEFDVATIYFNRFQSVISQIPTETQVIPASFERKRTTRPQRSTTTNRPKRAFWPTFCRVVWRRRSSPRFWKTPHPSRARGCPQWTTPPAMPAK